MAILLFYFSFYTQVLPQALRVSDHYPVEVELVSAIPCWVKKSNNGCAVVDTQQGSSRTVTGNEQNTNLLCLVPDRCVKSWDTAQLRKLDGKFTERKKAVISKCILTCILWQTGSGH